MASLYGWPTPRHRRKLASDQRRGAYHDQDASRRAGNRSRQEQL
jgi:hypothetical protein